MYALHPVTGIKPFHFVFIVAFDAGFGKVNIISRRIVGKTA
jgi:hypothetical protein